ncbi:MAG: hypothetical protein OEY18_02160 [Candidatus Aminicenantes bacterium]|nr:hypothetical protein [Candidatus Aminicenantes bacterium]MDH5383485.1 hypothetical protein [Candidatus Aminicenantes bacterium]MDH5742799.1 hypothetical protein [Candidatus Aminicenantes bacterium]
MTFGNKKNLKIFLFVLLIVALIGSIPSPALARISDAPDSKELRLKAQRLDSLFREIQETMETVPKDTFDLKDVVNKVGHDPVRLFEWVSDVTQLIPYQGSLKGPIGVLMDRQGNSLDRALLLYELLRLAGHRVQLVQGELSDAEAEQVFQDAIFIPGKSNISSMPPPITVFQERIKDFAERNQFDVQEFLAETNEMIKEEERISVELSRRVEEQSSWLMEAVKAYKKEAAHSPAAFEDLKYHWWVQYQKDGEWVDMDPTFRDVVPGHAIGEIKKIQRSSRLNSKLVHSLVIRLIIERLENGSLIEEKVLEQSIRPSDNIGESIKLSQHPMDWPDFKAMIQGNSLQGNFIEAVSKQKEWLPILSIGKKEIKRYSILESGSLNRTPGKKPTKKSGGGLTGGFGNAFGGSSQPKQKEDSELTAEWIEYEILSPGRPARKIRREIFDLIGPAARKSKRYANMEISEEQQMKRNLSILSQIEILPVVSRFTPEFIQHRSAQYLLSQKRTLLSFMQNFNGLEPDEILSRTEQLSSDPWALYSLALARTRLSRYVRESFLDSPNIFSSVSFLKENEKQELEMYQGIDIVANDIAVFPAEGIDSFAIKLEQGVLDTNVEVKPMMDERWIENTAVIFDRAKDQGINWILLKDVEGSDWNRVHLSPDVKARIEQDISEGFLAFVPEKAVKIDGKPVTGWWRLDPATGGTIGVGETGLGQAMTSYAERADIVLQLKSIVNMYADLAKCLALALTSPLRGTRPQHEKEFIECVWNTACKGIFKMGGKLVSVDVTWTNIIIKQTIKEATSNVCKRTFNKVFSK